MYWLDSTSLLECFSYAPINFSGVLSLLIENYKIKIIFEKVKYSIKKKNSLKCLYFKCNLFLWWQKLNFGEETWLINT